MAQRNWTFDELLAAFYVYSSEPFGRLHKGNPLVRTVAERIDRSPSAVAMKACNFASLDPTHTKRGVSGLGNVSKADREFWRKFEESPGRIMSAISNLEFADGQVSDQTGADDQRETDGQAYVKVRRGQKVFRDAVLVGYQRQCAISGIAIPELLVASHIVPWSVDKKSRLDPRNGIALNALYDRAFDKGLITFDEETRVVLSSELPSSTPLFEIEGKAMRMPERWKPLSEYLDYHRTHIFVS